MGKGRGLLMSAEVIPATVFGNEAPQPLFSVGPYLNSEFHQCYDVTPDGRFLMIRASDSVATSMDADLILVGNWFQELKEKLGN